MTPSNIDHAPGPSLPKDAWPLLQALKGFFDHRDHPAYLVGGFLRDSLLGRATLDVDLAVGGDAIAAARHLAQQTRGTFVLLDQAHAIARVILPPGSFGAGASERWQVDMAAFSHDIARDLARRDFTVDALALPVEHALDGPFRERILDYHGGLQDLEQGTIRALSDGVFGEDPVRLLRSARLSAQLGFTIDRGTRALATRDAHLLTTVAPERLRDELLGLLAPPGATSHLRLLDELGLLGNLIPELDAARGVEQPPEHYFDVFNHCLETPGHVERVTTETGRAEDPVLSHVPWRPSLEAYFDQEVSDGHSRRTIVKFTGLLHDIAKPATKTVEDSGRMRFIGHDAQGAEVGGEIARRLRLSGRGVHLVSTMIKNHLRPTQMSHGVEMPTRRATYRYYRDVEDAAFDTLFLNMADYLAAKGPSIEMDDWQGHCALVAHILQRGMEEESKPGVRRLVDGHVLMSALGLSPGAQLGRILESIQDAHGAGEISTRDEALDLARRLLDAS